MIKEPRIRISKSALKETASKTLFLLCAFFSILAVVAIFVFLILRGFPAIAEIGIFKFILGTEWNPVEGDFGILPMIVGSLYATAGAVLIGGGLGVLTAIFLAKFCPRRLKKPLTQMINLLAGIPSVIYGFFGMRVLLPLLGVFSPNGDGSGILAVSIILGIMIMPTVTALSMASIEAVSESYFEGAVALGASKEQAVLKVVVPAAKSGILSSVILGIGRAIGETMAVVMVAGNNTVFPGSVFSSFRTMTANIVLEMGYAQGLHQGALIATGIVLLVFIFIINVCFSIIAGRKAENRKGRKRKLDVNPGFAAFPVKISVAGKKISNVFKVLSMIATAIGVLSLVSIIVFVFISGLPHINATLLFGEFDYGAPKTILTSLVSTGMLILLASAIAFPLGIFTAIFLVEYTKKGSFFVKIIRIAIETLGGIPSIVYGLFGAVLFCGIFGWGTSILAGSFTISLMIIPTTVRATEEALKAVPNELREASFALGAGKLRTVFTVVLPSALPGILAAVLLGIGRMISESAPVLFTMGTSIKPMPKGYMDSGATLAVALYYLAREGKHTNEAYATACVLIIIVLLLNLISTLLVSMLQKKLTGGKKCKA